MRQRRRPTPKTSGQTAMVSGEVSRLGATPYDQLAPGTTTFTRTILGNGNPLKTE